MNENLQSQMMWQIMLDRTMRMHTDFWTSARINERRLVFLGQGYRSGLLKEKEKKKSKPRNWFGQYGMFRVSD